jgi:hypothetical protein
MAVPDLSGVVKSWLNPDGVDKELYSERLIFPILGLLGPIVVMLHFHEAVLAIVIVAICGFILGCDLAKVVGYAADHDVFQSGRGVTLARRSYVEAPVMNRVLPPLD